MSTKFGSIHNGCGSLFKVAWIFLSSLNIACGLAWAQVEGASDTLVVEALNTTGDDVFHGLLGKGMYFFAAILALIVLSGLISGFRKSIPDGPDIRRTRNLFLPFHFYKPSDTKTLVAHMRSIDLTTASFVAACPVQRGDDLRLSLGTLPGYPEDHSVVESVVTSCLPLGGEPESYLIRVKFLPSARARLNTPLSSYLRKLGDANHLSPA